MRPRMDSKPTGVSILGSSGQSTTAVIPKRAGRAVFEVLATMAECSKQHAQMFPRRIKMCLARGGHEWMPAQNDDLLFPFQRQLLQPLAEFKFFGGVKFLAEPPHFAEHI